MQPSWAGTLAFLGGGRGGGGGRTGAEAPEQDLDLPWKPLCCSSASGGPRRPWGGSLAVGRGPARGRMEAPDRVLNLPICPSVHSPGPAASCLPLRSPLTEPGRGVWKFRCLLVSFPVQAWGWAQGERTLHPVGHSLASPLRAGSSLQVSLENSVRAPGVPCPLAELRLSRPLCGPCFPPRGAPSPGSRLPGARCGIVLGSPGPLGFG